MPVARTAWARVNRESPIPSSSDGSAPRMASVSPCQRRYWRARLAGYFRMASVPKALVLLAWPVRERWSRRYLRRSQWKSRRGVVSGNGECKGNDLTMAESRPAKAVSEVAETMTKPHNSLVTFVSMGLSASCLSLCTGWDASKVCGPRDHSWRIGDMSSTT